MQHSSSRETDSSLLVKKLPTLYGTPHPPRFITVFTTARHVCLFWARCMRSTPCIPDSVKFSLMLFHLHLGLPGGLCSSDFSTKRTNAFLFFVRSACRAHLIVCDFSHHSKHWRTVKITVQLSPGCAASRTARL